MHLATPLHVCKNSCMFESTCVCILLISSVFLIDSKDALYKLVYVNSLVADSTTWRSSTEPGELQRTSSAAVGLMSMDTAAELQRTSSAAVGLMSTGTESAHNAAEAEAAAEQESPVRKLSPGDVVRM